MSLRHILKQHSGFRECPQQVGLFLLCPVIIFDCYGCPPTFCLKYLELGLFHPLSKYTPCSFIFILTQFIGILIVKGAFLEIIWSLYYWLQNKLKVH